MWRRLNANPEGKHVGDCTVRAISQATGMSWERAFAWLCVYGFALADMPSANRVWGHFLQETGFSRYRLPDTCPDCYTVKQFCLDHPKGTYVLALESHVICCRNGDYIDTWDSGEEVPLYVWRKEV